MEGIHAFTNIGAPENPTIISTLKRKTVLLSSIRYIIMNSDAGPSSQPLQNGEGSNTTMDIDQGSQSPVVDGGSTSGFKGKAKDIDW